MPRVQRHVQIYLHEHNENYCRSDHRSETFTDNSATHWILFVRLSAVFSGVSSQRNERKERKVRKERQRRKERKNRKLQPMGTELSSFLLN